MTIYFEITSKLNIKIHITAVYWEFIITVKHPSMNGLENLVKKTLEEPDEIRRSIKDKSVFVYYKKEGRHSIAVICKHLNGQGYIITTYKTDRIKIGEQVWKRQE